MTATIEPPLHNVGAAHEGRRILVAAFLIEGALALVFVLWAHYRHVPITLIPTWHDLHAAVVLAFLLLGFNHLMSGPIARESASLRSVLRFNDQVVTPFARSLSTGEALCLSILAGVGEELFFRGMLQAELGIIISSLLFAVLHFGTHISRFPLVALLYFVVSLGIGLAYALTGSLAVVIIAHALYDFLLLLLLKHSTTRTTI